jgi:hypothetical protein
MRADVGRDRKVIVALAAAMLVLAGCGSTVSGAASGGLAVTGSDGLGVAPSGSGSAPGVGSGSGAVLPAGGGVAGPAVSGSTTGPGGGSSAANGVLAPGSGSNSVIAADGPGVTATTINIAGVYCSSCAAGNEALGAADASSGDIQAEINAVIRYINGHGGVGRRKLVPVWFDASIYQPASTTMQEMCAAWTQDNHVFLAQTSGYQILNECVAKAHAVGIDTGAVTEATSAVHKQYPASIHVTGPTIDRAMTVTIQGLNQQGYFNKGKVGIVTWDDSYYRWSITHAAEPALADLGLRGVPVQYVPGPQQYSDMAATSAAVSNAILKFRQQGIDHVVILDGVIGVCGGGCLVLEWTQQASSQQYTPRYGLNSTSGLSADAPSYPKEQLIGSVGVGWIPTYDLTATDYPPSKLPPLGRLCLQIMRDAGINTSDIHTQLAVCDQLFFIQQVLGKVEGPLNQATALAAINAVGSRFHPAETFGTFLSAARHDGMTQVANVAFVESCTCYRYTSAPYVVD